MRGLDALACLVLFELAEGRSNQRILLQTHPDLRLQVKLAARIVGIERVIEIDECTALTRETIACSREVVQTESIMSSVGTVSGPPVMSRALDIVSGEHEHTCFSLGFVAQWHVNRHLVTVEVSVERGTNERMQTNSLAFNEHRLECLNAQTVKGWSAVQEHGMFRDDLFEHVPNVACATIHCALRCLDVSCIFKLDQTLDDEWFEELECHRRRQTALMQLQGRANNDYRTARVVNALTEQVLTETAVAYP